MDARATLIVYREELLGASETFIRAQGESLDRFRAFYLGLKRVPGLALPDIRFHIVTGRGWAGRLRRAQFKLCGPSTELRRMLAAHQPALIHAHFGLDACNAIALARALNIPLVTTFHGYDVTVKNEQMPRLYVRRQYLLKRFGSRFLCVSEFIRDRAIEKGFPPEKTIVHYTGIDTDLFDPHQGVSRSPIVLFVGRLVSKKGCEYLIRAMSRVQQVQSGVQLVVIGDGPLRPTLEAQAAATIRNFTFLGTQPPNVVKEWMNRSMVFCAPSLVAHSGDAEGFGMVFAEAQAMGLPVVSSLSGGIPEVVANEQTGFLVEERDWRSLADKLIVLLSDRDLWLRFSMAGRARVRTRFDLWKQTAILENIYESVLAEQTCSQPETPTRLEHQQTLAAQESVALSTK